MLILWNKRLNWLINHHRTNVNRLAFREIEKVQVSYFKRPRNEKAKKDCCYCCYCCVSVITAVWGTSSDFLTDVSGFYCPKEFFQNINHAITILLWWRVKIIKIKVLTGGQCVSPIIFSIVIPHKIDNKNRAAGQNRNRVLLVYLGRFFFRFV